MTCQRKTCPFRARSDRATLVSTPARNVAFLMRTAVAMAASALLTSLAAPAWADRSELPTNFAYNYGETETPRTAAFGGALHALGTGTAAPFTNPAGMGSTRVYHIEALGQFTPEAARQLYGGAIVDSTRRLSGGVTVIGGFQDPDGVDRSHIDVRAALAFAVSERFHLGLSGRYMNLEQEGFGLLGQSRTSGGLLDPDAPPNGRSALVNTVTFDAGLIIRPIDELFIAGFGQNLSYPDNGILPTLVGGGIGYSGEMVSVEVDGLADFNSWGKVTPRFMGGAEVLLANSFPLRAGYRYDNGANSHQVSGGLGYLDQRFSVEASVRRTVAGPSATNIVVSLAYYLESTGLTPIDPY